MTAGALAAPTIAGVPGLPGLPGIALPGRLPGRHPRELLSTGTLLLAGVQPGRPVGLVEHTRLWGWAPVPGSSLLVEQVAAAGIVGAGGAGFPTDRKIAALAGRRVSHVVVNGAEGESASGKDGVLLGHVPHLVLDGAQATARALGAGEVVVRIGADRPDLAASLAGALAERRDEVPVTLSIGPSGFVAGEATAVIRALAGGPALPTALGLPPVLPSRRPGRRTHVMLSNVETFARVALAIRGITLGSWLASASGAVRVPGVVELAPGASVADLGSAAGGVLGMPDVLITGGWHGRWVSWDSTVAGTPLGREGLASVGGRWGAGAFVWLPEDLDPLRALAGVAQVLAEGTAGQCGPCWRGLPAVAQLLGRVAAGELPLTSVEATLAQVDGRGICAHPSAAVAAVRSAMELIAEHSPGGRR